MRGRKLIVALMAVAGAGVLHAGELESPRGVGMARTFVATSRGLDAVGINPANLGIDDGSGVQVDLFPFGVHVGSDFLSYDLYTTYFTGVDTGGGRDGRFLSPQDKQRILDAFPNGNGLVSMNADMRYLGVSFAFEEVGRFAFTVSEHAGGMVNIPRDYLALLLNGNIPGTTLDFSNTDIKLAWTREYALSFGRTIPHPPFLKSLEAGIGLKLVQGFAYYDVERFDASLSTASDGALTGAVNFLSRTAGIDAVRKNNSGSFSPFTSPAGSGIALDLGVAGAVNQFLTFGMSVTDIGSLTWNTNVEQRLTDTVLVIDDLFSKTQRDALNGALAGAPESGTSFSSNMPTQFRMGVAIEVDKLPLLTHFPGELRVALDYNQGFHDTYASTINARVSLGAEYIPLSWLPIRAGVSFGGTDRVNTAFGFGIHAGGFQFDLASENVSWLFAPSTFSYGSLSLGMRLNI